MSRMSTLARITRNLAIIRIQLEQLSRLGMYMPRFTEELACRTLNSVSSRPVLNLNTTSNNFPGIDLRSVDETIGYQVTRHVTKAKYNVTAAALAKESAKSDNAVHLLQSVYVVGLTCVENAAIRRWTPVHSANGIRIRAIELHALLDFPSLTDETLLEVDDVIQDFVHDWSRPRDSDANQIRTVVGWLDRPAIRDIRVPEMDWGDMATAMRGVRRLLAQGVDDLGHPVSRPMSTFRDPYDRLLRSIFRASHRISAILTPRLRDGGYPTTTEVDDINRLRLEIQYRVNDLCAAAGITPPRW